MANEIELSHGEFKIMTQMKEDVLTNYTNEQTAENLAAYEGWQRFMAEEIDRRGVACQNCRLGRH